MDQEKRVMLAFALSFGVLLVWRAFVFKQAPVAPTTAPPVRPVPSAKAQAPSPAPAPRSTQLAVLEGGQAQEITVEGDLYRVTFDTRGAVIKSWVLKKYRDEKNNPLDLVDRDACESLGFPLSLGLTDAELAKRLNAALYVATPDQASLKAPAALEFAYSDGKVQSRKKFSFGPGYEAHAEVSVFDGARYWPVDVAWPGGFGDHSLSAAQAASNERAFYQPAGSTSVKEERLARSWFSSLGSSVSGSDPKELEEEIPGSLALAGLADRYFVNVMLPDSPDVRFHIRRQAWTPPDWKGEEKNKPKPLLATLEGAQPQPLAFRLFVAPKDLDVLRAAHPPLDALVDFGWFSVVAKPLFVGLRYIYDRWIHNYGWAIILLTVVINLALFPLKLKSIRSGQEMQRIGPQLKAIQERYKQYKFNDPRKQRMQEEQMKLYKEHGINPLGGCLPMALQMPFLYAFYNVLGLAIELRHAPWILWVKDLSSVDHLPGFPLPVLPLVMIVVMFVLQRMTPVPSVDPAQQRMMTTVMPLMFGFMFLNAASGLVLYWLTGSLVGIAQQALINRWIPPTQAAPVSRRPSSPAED